MRTVLLTQRVVVDPSHGERRDALDQRWAGFVLHAGFLPVPLPNRVDAVPALLEACAPAGIVLTGGNDLADYGGDAPERDATERELLARAEALGVPVLAVCRGMQLVQHLAGVRLERVEGHVCARQEIVRDGGEVELNSYHRYGSRDTAPELEVWARAADGVVKAVRHRSRPLLGIMWHPERLAPFHAYDFDLVRRHFAPRGAAAR